MFIKLKQKPAVAWTLVEMMVGVGVFMIAAAALASMMMFTLRGFTAAANYALLDQYNRQAMDQMTYEIRQASAIVDYASNSTSSTLSIVNGTGDSVAYTFDANKQQVRRAILNPDGSINSSKVLLTNCNLLYFSLFMRPPTNGTFEVYPVDMNTNWQQSVKVVQLSWKTQMTISPTMNVNSEDIQTARIVIRKQQQGS